VLVLSFVKQVYNYLFVAVEEQNILFKNNVIGVILGVALGLYVIPRRNLLGGVITQIFIECVYTFGAMRIAKGKGLTPVVQKKPFWTLAAILLLACGIGWGINQYLVHDTTNWIHFLVCALVFNGAILLTSFRSVKTIAKGLTMD